MIQPRGNRVLLERLDGDGREEQLTSGLWMPARDQSLRHGNAARVPDTFKARVLAVSAGATKATEGGIRVGDDVLVHTYEQTNQKTLVGDVTPYGLLVDIENVLGVYEDGERACAAPNHSAACSAMNAALNGASARAFTGVDRDPADYDQAPIMGLIPKTKDFEPSAVGSLGFHRRNGKGF